MRRREFLRKSADLGALAKRTVVGGPYASSQPEALLPLADHATSSRFTEGSPEPKLSIK
jgi:hypothetical protein